MLLPYFLGGLFPLPPPDGFPVVLGALEGLPLPLFPPPLLPPPFPPPLLAIDLVAVMLPPCLDCLVGLETEPSLSLTASLHPGLQGSRLHDHESGLIQLRRTLHDTDYF